MDETYRSEKSSNHGTIVPRRRSKNSNKSSSSKTSSSKKQKQIVPFQVPKFDRLVVRDPHPFNRIPSRILKEEDYVAIMERIIERDYFPDLPRLKALRNLLSARRDKDQVKYKEARRFLDCMTPLSVINTPLVLPTNTSSLKGNNTTKSSKISDVVRSTSSDVSASPYPSSLVSSRRSHRSSARSQMGGEGDDSVIRIKMCNGKHVEIDLAKYRLNDFQSDFTSEDNASFEEIINKEKMDLTNQQSWIENSAQSHNTKMISSYMALEDIHQPLALPATTSDNNLVISSLMEPRTALYFPPPSIPEIKPKIRREADKSVANRNSRFPTALQDSNRPLALQQHKMQLLEETRQKEQRNCEMIMQGKFEIEATPDTIFGLNSGDDGTKQGYGFLKTPTILPGKGIDKSPMMTWGQVVNTPLLVGDDMDASDSNFDSHIADLILSHHLTKGDDGMRFDLPRPSPKELTAVRLTENASHKLFKRPQLKCGGSSSIFSGKSKSLKSEVLGSSTPLPSGACTPLLARGKSDLFKNFGSRKSSKGRKRRSSAISEIKDK